MKIIIVDNEHDVAALAEALQYASQAGKSVRFAVDGDVVKFKIGGGMWAAGFGQIDPDSDYAYEQRVRREQDIIDQFGE